MRDAVLPLKAQGFIRKHWRGEYSLPRSFWLNTVAVAYLAPLAALDLLSWNPWYVGRATSVAFVAILVVFYPSLVWGLLGTARAGTHYQERGGRSIWVGAAIWITLFLFVDSIGYFLASRGIVIDHVRMAFTGRYGPPASITVIKNGSGLLIAGELRAGSADLLALTLRHSPAVSSVTLDSKGGLLSQANLMAARISQHRLDTYVVGQCSSACTFLFLAGKRRCMAAGARLGFHEATYDGQLARDTFKNADALERNMYIRAGLPQAFIDRVMKTPDRQVWYPSREELLATHITTYNCH